METYFYGRGFGEKGLPLLNIGAIEAGTRALGPGLRAALWTQGCPFLCKNCISPELIPDKQVSLISPEEIIQTFLSNSEITGITISGGEPMLQAAGLAKMLKLAREKRKLNVICFTGCVYTHLLSYPKGSGIHSILSEIDVLIDGQYIRKLDDNRGLRGSSNQRIHYLTNTLQNHDFENGPRKIELIVRETSVISIGIPPRNVAEAVQQSFSKLNRRKK